MADASAIILSCPGPPRRHGAALLPLAGVALPQVLLGSESQLLAFAAWLGRDRPGGDALLFAPLPEIFAASVGLDAALANVGRPAGTRGGAVHLRFGGVRGARVLKGVRNAAVLAELAGLAPLTASHHPFATGTVLPAAMERVFALGPGVVRPQGIGGAALPVVELPGMLDADLVDAADGPGGGGLELICLADYQAGRWADAGTVHAWPGDAGNTVLVPWNMDHPGSVVPELLARLGRLYEPGCALPHVMLLPFNYIGQTGIVRELVGRLREASRPAGVMLPQLFLGRVRDRAGIAALRALSRVAWVDGNDPEHWWSLGRLQACGVSTVLIDPGVGEAAAGGSGMGGVFGERGAALRVVADEAVWVEVETRCGAMIFAARLPSMRALPGLLRMTAGLRARDPGLVPAPAPASAAAAAVSASAGRRRPRLAKVAV